jgi:hypothetical protein
VASRIILAPRFSWGLLSPSSFAIVTPSLQTRGRLGAVALRLSKVCGQVALGCAKRLRAPAAPFRSAPRFQVPLSFTGFPVHNVRILTLRGQQACVWQVLFTEGGVLISPLQEQGTEPMRWLPGDTTFENPGQ